MATIFGGGVLAILAGPQKAKAALKMINVTSSPTFATITNTKTIKGKWTIDVGKYIKEGLNTDVYTRSLFIEFKFIISIDGKAIDQIVIGRGLPTDTTPYGKENYNSYIGEVIQSAPDETTPFGIHAIFDSNGFASFTLIDNITIPKIDKGTPQKHTYTIQPMWSLPYIDSNGQHQREIAYSSETKSGVYTPGSTTASTKDGAWYMEHYFNNDAANFVVGDGGTKMNVAGLNSTITIPAKDFGNSNKRPELTFKLTTIIPYGGPTVRDAEYFVFVNKDLNASNLAIIISGGYTWRNCDKNVDHPFAAINSMTVPDGTKTTDWWSDRLNVHLRFDKANDRLDKNNIFFKFLDSMYDGGPYGQNPGQQNQCPLSSQLNQAARSIFGTDAQNVSQTENPPEDETCDYVGRGIGLILAKVLCAILTAMGKGSEWLIDTLGITTVINAYSPSQYITALSPFSIHKVYAQDPNPGITEPPNKSSIKKALDGEPPWILKSWKVVLGLADVFVVIILLFLAITNILHIKYDDYAIKKSLPTLIAGVILANFSVFITKMLVDATNALTATFTGGDAGTMVKDIITAVIPTDGKPQFLTTTSLFGLILAIFFAFFAIVVFLILGFLFYIRYIVILTLTIAAPLAFVLMAFPPTQGIFKQWWGWYAKFIFMKPISIFLLYLASMVLGTSEGKNLTAWAIAVFLSVAAIIVPFKMGGAIMGGWGALGKKGAGLAAQPIKKELGYQKERLGKRFNRFLNERTPIGTFRSKRRMEDATLDEQLKGSEKLAESRLPPELRAKHMLRRRRALRGTELGEAQETEMTSAIEAGESLEGLTEEDYRKITGMSKPMEIAESYMEISNRIRYAKSALEKRRDIDTNIAALEDSSNHSAVSEQMKQDLRAAVAQGTAVAGVHGISINRSDSLGNITVAAGAAGNNLETYADMVNMTAEFRAKAKTASSPADKARLIARAEEYEGQLRSYRQNNAALYDYDVILDRNSYGRRFKESNTRAKEEADVTVMSSTGHSVVDDTRGDHGTSEYRATAEGENRALVGKWDENERTENFAIKQHHMAIQQFMTQGARGDVEGVHTINEFINRIQEAHDWDSTTNGAAAQVVRRDIIQGALGKMNVQQRENAQDAMAKQFGHSRWADVQAAGEENNIMNSLNLEGLNIDNTREGRAQLALIQQVAFAIKDRPQLGLNKSPASSMTKARANAHPRS